MITAGIANHWPFVAREAELGVLLPVLQQGIDAPDEPSGAVVVAPAGVGKSRLLRETERVARDRGLRTGFAVATQSARTTPYGVFAHLLPRSSPGPEEDIGAWYRYVAEALRGDGETRAGAHRPVLFIDDAHLLDAGSAALVLHLTMTGDATVLAAVRRFEPVPDPVTTLWKDGLALRIDLQPFSVGEIDRLIRAALDDEVSPHTSHRLARMSGGNVLFAHELVLGAAATGSLSHRDGAWRWNGRIELAPRLVDAVGLRLEGLSAEALEALAVFAIAEPVPLRVAESLIDAGVIERLESIGLIELEGRGHEVACRLNHPLYGEVALARTGQVSVRRLKRRLADTLAGAEVLRGDRDVLRIASWRLEAGGNPSVESLTEAATLANQSYDHLLAERLARAAVHRGAGPTAAIALALAQARANQFAEAEQTLNGAEAAVLAADDPTTERDFLDCLHQALYMGLGRGEETVARMDAFLGARVGTDPIRARATERRAAAYRAQVLLDGGDVAGSLAVLTGVLPDDPRQDDPRQDGPSEEVESITWMLGLETAGEALLCAGDLTAARRAHAWLRDLAATGHPEVGRAASSAVLQEVLALLLEGRVREALPVVSRLRTQMINHPDPAQRALSSLVLGGTHLRQGTVVSARRTLLDAVAGYRELDIGAARGWALSLVAQVHALLGEADAARETLEECHRNGGDRRILRTRLDLRRAETLAQMATGDVAGAARRALESAAELVAAPMHQVQLLHLAARLGAAPEAHARLAPVVAGMECGYAGLLLRHVSALAAQDAAELATVAAAFAERGQWLVAAEAHAAASVAHHQSGQLGAAAREAAASRVLATRCEGARTPGLTLTPVFPALSRREREVAQLASTGMTNSAIAEQLVLSVRTVESHLYQAFGKLGVRHRSELAVLVDGAETGQAAP